MINGQSHTLKHTSAQRATPLITGRIVNKGTVQIWKAGPFLDFFFEEGWLDWTRVKVWPTGWIEHIAGRKRHPGFINLLLKGK